MKPAMISFKGVETIKRPTSIKEDIKFLQEKTHLFKANNTPALKAQIWSENGDIIHASINNSNGDKYFVTTDFDFLSIKEQKSDSDKTITRSIYPENNQPVLAELVKSCWQAIDKLGNK